MRKLLILLLAMAVVIGVGSWSSPAQAASIVLNLRGSWNPNSEPDMAGYHLWFFSTTWERYTGAIQPDDPFTSGPGTLILVPLSPTQLDFNKTVNTIPATGTLKFGLEAKDVTGNVSAKSESLYSYNTDISPPAAPANFTVIKRP